VANIQRSKTTLAHNRNKGLSAYIIIFVLSIAALSFAYIAQYLFDIMPCKLCIYERIPYIIIAFFSVISILLPLRDIHNKINWIIIELSLIASFCLALFHFGVEQKIFKFNSACINNLQKSENFQSFKTMLLKQDYVLCDQIEFQVFGVSSTLWNALYSVFFFLVVVNLNLKGNKNA
jgi:disulfide bond formation protein DsbB